MGHYNGNAAAVHDLVRETEVHRDVYIDREIFDLEMEHLFANTWIYVGHDSQVPNAGDYYGTTIGKQPVLMVRHTDGVVHVLYNRCPHKGTRITIDTCGNAGKFFRCPYHAWSFKTDGSLLAIPLRKGYEHTGLEQSEAIQGIPRVRHMKNYRGFVFAKMSDAGPDFDDYFGESLSTIDNMIDRSPAGRLEVAGGVLRYMHNCNWKMLVENLTDTCHPMVAHEASAGTAVEVWKKMFPGSNKKPPAVEIYSPFIAPYEFFEKMGIRIWRNGHGHTGVHHSIHSDYSAIPGYFDKMVAAYGEERAKAILDENRHNTSYFPEFHREGADPGDPAVQADRAEPHAGRILDLPSGRRAGSAPRAHLDLQPADQRADLDRRPRRPRNVRARPRGVARRCQSVGQHSAPVRPGGSRAGDRRHQRHLGMADAQSIPGLVEVHDHVALTGLFAMTVPTEQDLIGFVVHEARLIDQHRFEEWLDLFADDGYYWMPLEWGQTDPRLSTSLMYEDKLLLRIRVERLKGNRTFSQKPKSRCHHVLQIPQIDKRDEAANEYVTWTPMHYVETRLDEQDLYAAWATHTLTMVNGTLKIKLKRVDLVNCDAALRSIQLFM